MIKLTIQEINQEPRQVEVKEGTVLGLIANSYGLGTKLLKVEVENTYIVTEWTVETEDWSSKFFKKSDAIAAAEMLKGKLSEKRITENGQETNHLACNYAN